MAKEAPLWRQMFDAVEGPLGDQAAAIAKTGDFSSLLLFATQNWQTMNAKSRDALAGLMHLSNVPTHGDVTKLSRQIGSLTGKIETILARLEVLGETLDELRDELRADRAMRP